MLAMEKAQKVKVIRGATDKKEIITIRPTAKFAQNENFVQGQKFEFLIKIILVRRNSHFGLCFFVLQCCDDKLSAIV